MSNTTPVSRAVFWIVAGIALVWNGLGCINFIQQLSPAGIASLPEDYQAFIATRPMWSTAAFAVSVIAGLLGAIFLMMRSSHAAHTFWLSCIGAVVSMIPTFGAGITSIIVGSAMSAVLAALFALYAARTLRQR